MVQALAAFASLACFCMRLLGLHTGCIRWTVKSVTPLLIVESLADLPSAEAKVEL